MEFPDTIKVSLFLFFLFVLWEISYEMQYFQVKNSGFIAVVQ